MSLWLILLIIGVGTVPFIVIAILVEAAVGNDEDEDKRAKRARDERPVIPFDFD